ncbi:lipopolysaccharide heptosyltransferase I [Oryzomonas japonica]|uniref:Lipopolysaccharide heptosyltransferase 1 n=1 Tax=Oryzomonas japonica TaxID=2603858 RepID=A0A7J4ZQ51_9BACT|nr:lipopolysaccharide heptosyltransferase I [Oryzomonas japonica]KAB0665148.1 lipopolysaccharide heptosyltransferase I [Oryzomonas japonica]
MKIAFVRLTSLGDIILCMAALQVVRRRLPECHITWVAERRFADILDHNPDIQQIIRVDLKELKRKKSLTALRAEYRRLASCGDFDVVIDLHGMLKSAVIAASLGGVRYGFARQMLKEPLAGLFYNRSVPVPLDLPAVCRYTALAAQSLGLDFRPDELCPPKPYLFWGEGDGAATEEYFATDKRNILLVPETSASYKNYPPEKFARIANLLPGNIMICHGNQQEFLTASQIAERAPHARVLPRLNLNQLKAAVGRCDLVIGGDSGPTHIAWACGVSSITLFGATPVCICPTERNRVITTSSVVNLRKPDSRDDSVGHIAPEEIARLAQELLA